MEESKHIKNEEAEQKTSQPSAEKSESKARVKRDNLEELVDVILQRSASAGPTLRAMLAGTVELFVKDRPYRVSFDFSANPPARIEKTGKQMDCLIEIEERNLFKIDQGELNPQLALVTDKIRVHGKAGLAVYFFNLLT